MPEYKRELEIEVDLNAKTGGGIGNLQAALTEIRTAAEGLEDDFEAIERAAEDFEPEKLEGSDISIGGTVDESSIVKAVGEARAEAATAIEDEDAVEIPIKAVTDDIDIDTEEIDEQINKYDDLSEAAKAARGEKDDLEKQQEKLKEQTESTVLDLDKEANSFKDLTDSGSSVAEAKEAAARSNELLNEEARESNKELGEEIEALDDLDASAERIARKLNMASEENKELHRANQQSTSSITDEFESAKNLGNGLDDLTAAKHAASNANRNLDSWNRETAKSMAKERDITEKTMLSIMGLSEATDNATDSTRSLRRRTREMTNEMRAANKVGGLFEDGFGSLSVNLGAFTVAMRNFLTQVPILVAALGSLGTAAAGVAGSFITAGSAIGAVIGAGALARAEQLESEYSQIEGTGQALQVMMRSLRDLFRQAVDPLVSNAETIDLFRRSMVGLAEEVSLVANAFNNLITLGDKWEGRAQGISGVMAEMNSRLSDDITDVVQALSTMFILLQDEMIDILEGTISAMADFINFATRFTNGITESSESIDVFIDSASEMALLGRDVFAGLIPIFTAFFSAVGEVASALNQLDQEMLANIVTFAALFAAVNKFGGAIGGVITLLPDFIFGLRKANGSIMTMASSIGRFVVENDSMLGGLTDLVTSVNDAKAEMIELSVATQLSDSAANEFSDEIKRMSRDVQRGEMSLEEMKEELIQLAAASDLAEDEIPENLDIDADVDRDVGGDRMIMPFLPPGIQKKLAKVMTKVRGLTTILTGFAGTLTGILGTGTVLVAILLLLGALFVGLIGNLDSAVAAFKGLFGIIKDFVFFVAGEFLSLFITTFNAIVDVFAGFAAVFSPIISLFGDGKSEGSALSATIDILATAVEILFEVLKATIFVLATTFRWVGEIIGFFVELAITIATTSEAFKAVQDAVSGLTGGSLPGWLETVKEAFNDAIFIAKNFETAMIIAAVNMERMWIEAVNHVLKKLKSMNEAVPKEARFESISEIEIAEPPEEITTAEEAREALGEGARVNREEFFAGTETAMEAMPASRDNTINLEEDNSTNVDQTINADPEEKEQLSRTVKDAMEEANSFSRRQQGAQ